MTTTTQKISLSDFGPSSVWFVSIGYPTGTTIKLWWDGDDTESGQREPMDPYDQASALPFGWDLLGTVDESGDWQWDGLGDPCDERRNTVTTITASRPEPTP
jgi:hypothetical protein